MHNNAKTRARLSGEQNRFLERWLLAGGAHAKAEDVIDPDESVLYSAADGSGWQYLCASARHSDVLQTALSGYFQNHLSDRHFSFGSMQNDSVFRSGEACVFGWPGAIGAARGFWSERLVVPVQAPKGMSRAVVSHFSWAASAPRSTLATLAMVSTWLDASYNIPENHKTTGRLDILDRISECIRAGGGEKMSEAVLLRNHLEAQLFGMRT